MEEGSWPRNLGNVGIGGVQVPRLLPSPGDIFWGVVLHIARYFVANVLTFPEQCIICMMGLSTLLNKG